MYFNYFCQLLRTSIPNYHLFLAKVIEIQNTIRTHCESINQYLFNKQKKHKHYF